MGLGSNPKIHTCIIREQKLREVGKLEHDLVFGDAGTKEVIKFLSMHTDLSRENKLRLLMVYAAIYPEKFEGDKGSQLMQEFDWLLSFPILDHIYTLQLQSQMFQITTLCNTLLRCSIKLVCMMLTQRLWHIMEHLSNCLPERFSHLNETNDPSLNHDCGKKIVRLEKGGAIHKPESGGDANTEKKQNKVNQAENTKKLSEEKRLMKEQERSRKAELKDETAKQKQLAKERKKLEKHKFSEKDIVAVIDPKVLSGSVGGRLGKGILVIS